MNKEVRLGFLSEETSNYQVKRWLADEEVCKYLYRGKVPSTGNANINEEIEFEVISTSDKVIIATAGVHSINWISRSGELRLLIGEKAYWNKGYGQVIVRKVLIYAFGTLNLNRIWLGVNAENVAALALYKKSGFRVEGVLREEFYKYGKFTDIIRLAVLRKDWERDGGRESV